jgi:hypothetical protein
MAQKTIVQLFDDLDGSSGEDITTVSFALDGVEYEIDLGEANASRLRDALEEFISAGRRIGGRAKRGSSPRSNGQGAPRSKEDTKAIREWARQNSHDISERGRIPAAVIEAYESARSAPQTASPSSEAAMGRQKRKPATAAFSN